MDPATMRKAISFRGGEDESLGKFTNGYNRGAITRDPKTTGIASTNGMTKELRKSTAKK